ncbi:hypothetical protein [Fontibacillus sp. BL9]|uniref:hypothetical protein n=1 Tax=Fontibacillus sp. BL9 TaxID=3389971 RepID=UPI00397D1002
MKLGTTFAQLEEMKVMAAGHPEKIAKYSQAKKQYDEMIAEFFNEESGVKFIAHPLESYVAEIEAKAEESGDPGDKARAIIMRDRLNHYEKEKTKHVDWRTSRERLRSLIDIGAKISDKDIREAERVARHNPSAESRVLYARLKTVKQAQEDGTYTPPAPPETPKVTAEDVEAALTKAQKTSATRDIAEYSALKRKFEAQEGAIE